MNYFLFSFTLSTKVILFYFLDGISILTTNCFKFEDNLKYSSIDKPSTKINLKEVFLKHAKTYYPKENCSIIIYGIPENINDIELSTYVINLLRTKLKISELSSSHIESIKRIGSIRTWVRPVQVAFMTKDKKELVLRHKHLLSDCRDMRIDDFLSKQDIIRVSILTKYVKQLRKNGYYAAIRHRKLIVDHKLINSTKENLLKMFPDISARHLEGL